MFNNSQALLMATIWPRQDDAASHWPQHRSAFASVTDGPGLGPSVLPGAPVRRPGTTPPSTLHPPEGREQCGRREVLHGRQSTHGPGSTLRPRGHRSGQTPRLQSRRPAFKPKGEAVRNQKPNGRCKKNACQLLCSRNQRCHSLT